MAKKAPRTKNKDNARRSKKKTSVLVQESVDYIDYKDINLLRRFMSDRAKIRARRVTGNDAQQQREVARAIKNAREMALLPYTNRVTTQRTSRDRGPGGPGRADGPPPRPAGPPPSTGGDGAAEEVARVLVPAVITVKAKAGTEGRLFGSVTSTDVATAVQDQTGIELDRRKLQLDEPIKSVGTHQIPTKLHPDVEFAITIEVVNLS